MYIHTRDKREHFVAPGCLPHIINLSKLLQNLKINSKLVEKAVNFEEHYQRKLQNETEQNIIREREIDLNESPSFTQSYFRSIDRGYIHKRLVALLRVNISTDI